MAAITPAMATSGTFFDAYTGASIHLPESCKMTQYYRDILIDQQTSWTINQAVALLLGRRSWDPIYRDQNPDADPEEVREQFMEWLDISIFEDLTEERDDILSALDDALGDEENKRDEVQVTLCRERIVQCDDTIRRAKLILCDIDDELAKGAQSRLIKDPVAAEKTGQVRLTLSSLKQWASGRDYLTMPLDATQTQNASPAHLGTEIDEPLVDPEGGMSAKSAKSFLITFAVLLEQFVARTGMDYVSESGTGFNEQKIIELLCEKSLPGARKGQYLDDQSVTSIKGRLQKVIDAAVNAALLQRAKPQKVKKVIHKS